MNTLYVIRGIPGSGKSTLARQLVFLDRYKEADMFFVDPVTNVYTFNPNNLKEAHMWCFNEIKNLMIDTTREDCAVSNTFSQLWEYKYYLDIAKENGYTPYIIECQNEFTNTHNVPEETMKKMYIRWERPKYHYE